MSMHPQGSLAHAVLATVARLGADAYGLAVRREVSARLDHDYSIGAIYTTLDRLERRGLLVSHQSDPLPVRGGRARRHFVLTAEGHRALHDAQRRVSAVWDGLSLPLPERP
jgi:DNA-binding PadR family transcriptional regulator